MTRLLQKPIFLLDGDGGGGGGTGGDGGNAGAGGDGGAGEGNKTKTEGEKTLTQAEVNAIATREKEAGKRTAMEEVAKTLGVSVEEAKTIVAEHNKRTEGEKSEAQRAADAANKARAEADAEKATAAQEKHDARVEAALIRAGVSTEDEGKLARIARLVEAEVGADKEAVAAAVKALQKEMPELFGDPGKPGSGDSEGKPPRNGPKDENSLARGMKRAEDAAKAKGQGDGPGGYDLP